MAKNKKKVGIILSDADLKRRYPSAGAASIVCDVDHTLWLPSSILAVNWQYGGGIPYGTILEGFGMESTGKSLLAVNFAISTQALGGVVLWSDAEAVFRQQAKWYQRLGLDLSRVQLLPDENTIEKISDWQADMIVTWRSKLKNNEPILLVEDSTAALESQGNMDAADSDSGEDMGRRSKKIYQMVRKRNPLYARYGVCVIYINQMRRKPVKTKYEDPDTTPGGLAMNFFASIRSGLYKGKSIYNKDKKRVGQNVYFRIKKSKVCDPREAIKTQVYFMEHEGRIGYSKYHGLVDVLWDKGIIVRRKGSWVYKGTVIGKDPKKEDENFVKAIERDEDLRRRLIKKAHINTISKTRELIENTIKNLYPVSKRKKKSDGEES